MDTNFGSESYSKEELIAQLGSSFLCNEAEIINDSVIENSAAYLQNWMTALKNDKRLFVQASAKAAKAVNYILNKKEETDDSNGK